MSSSSVKSSLVIVHIAIIITIMLTHSNIGARATLIYPSGKHYHYSFMQGSIQTENVTH